MRPSFDDDLWVGGLPPEPPGDLPEEPPAQVIDLAERRAGRHGGQTSGRPAKRTGLGATPFQAGAGYARRFPTERLPEQMREYVHDLAIRKQVPVDLPALTMLGIIGAVAGPRFEIRRDTDWMQPLNIYTCCALLSGAGKSPVVDELRKGAYRAQKLLGERHRRSIGEQIEGLKQQGESLHRQANVTYGPAGEQLRMEAKAAEAQADQLQREPPPPPELIFDGDTTVEALSSSMAANGGAGAIVDDEGTFFRVLGGMYNGGKATNLGLVLVGYDCRFSKPQRVGRAAAPIDRAALSLVISPQPNIVADVMRDQMMAEAGVINRFIVNVPGDLTGMREQRPATYYRDAAPGVRPDRVGRTWWGGLLSGLIDHDQLGQDEPGDDAIIDLTFAAFKRHREYELEFERRLHPETGDLVKIRQWGTKHVARVLRLAGLLHLAAGRTTADELDESVMEDAIAIGEWTIEHFIAAGPAAGLSTDAGRIKEFIDGIELGYCSRSALFKKVFNGHASSKVITECVQELVATGEYEVRERKGRGRKAILLGRVGFVEQVGGEDAAT